MEIFGVYISWQLITVILLIILVYIGIRYVGYRFRTSVYGLLWNALKNALATEKEDFDLKPYDMKEDIKKIDSDFNQNAFLDTVENAIRQYCIAMSTNDERLLLSFETPSLFERHKNIISQNRSAKKINVHQLVEFLGTNFTGVNSEQGRLMVEARVNMRRYTTNLTGELLSGSKVDLKKVIYGMEFAKAKSNLDTTEQMEVNCPNCGAPHTIHTAGICEYCGTMIVTFKDNWLLDEFRIR